jgi:excisionase family DNA binding protein
MAKRWYTKRQVAETLQVHDVTVDRMVADGRLPKPIKLGTARNSPVRFDAAAVDAAVGRMARVAA